MLFPTDHKDFLFVVPEALRETLNNPEYRKFMRKLFLLIVIQVGVLVSARAQVQQLPWDDSLVGPYHAPTLIQGYRPVPSKTFQRVLTPMKATQDTADIKLSTLIEDV